MAIKTQDCQKPVHHKSGYNENKFSKNASVATRHTKREEAYVEEIYVVNSNLDPKFGIWICALLIMTPHKELIDDYKKFNIHEIETGNSVIEVEGEGNATFLLQEEKCVFAFNNVLHMPVS